MEVNISSLKETKEILKKMPQTEEMKKYINTVNKELNKEIKKLKMTNKLERGFVLPEEILMKNMKSKMERIDEINKEIRVLEKKTDIKAIKVSLYDEISSGKYSEILKDMKELEDLIKKRTLDNVVKIIKKDDLLYDLKEKLKDYEKAFDKFHIKNPIEDKVTKIREENVKKIDSLKTEKKIMIVDMKDKKEKASPKAKEKIGSLLDLISQKEDRFNKGHLDTSKVIETGNER